MAKERTPLKNREELFINYFGMSVYALRITAHCLSFAKGFCADSAIKNYLHKMGSQMETSITNLLHLCKQDSVRDFHEDLDGEELQAIGSIMTTLVQLDSVVNAEDRILAFIRAIHKSEPGYQRQLLENQNELQIDRYGKVTIEKEDVFFTHDTVYPFCSRCCYTLIPSITPILYAWPEQHEPHYGEIGEYMYCESCANKMGFYFKTKNHTACNRTI